MHQYVCLYSLHYCSWIFRSDRNYSSNCQKGKKTTQIPGSQRMMQTQETTFVQLRVLIYLLFDFQNPPPHPSEFCIPFHLVSPPGDFFIPFPIAAPPGNAEGGKCNIILQVLILTSVCFGSPNQSQLCIFPEDQFCCVPSHAPLPTDSFGSINPLHSAAMRRNIKSDPGNLWSREGEMTLPQILFPPSLFIRNFPAGMFLKERLPLIKLSLPQVGLIYSRGQKLLTWQVLTRPLTNKTVNHQHFQQGCHSLGKDAVHHKPPCWNYKAPFPSQGLSKQSSLRKGSTTAPINRNKKCSWEQKLNKRC